VAATLLTEVAVDLESKRFGLAGLLAACPIAIEPGTGATVAATAKLKAKPTETRRLSDRGIKPRRRTDTGLRSLDKSVSPVSEPRGLPFFGATAPWTYRLRDEYLRRETMALWCLQKQGKSYLDSAERAMLKGSRSAPSQRHVGQLGPDRFRAATKDGRAQLELGSPSDQSSESSP
jgi:hypothetical protein